MEMLSTLRAGEHEQKLSTETPRLFAAVTWYFLSSASLGLAESSHQQACHEKGEMR